MKAPAAVKNLRTRTTAGEKLLRNVRTRAVELVNSKIPGLFFQHIGISHTDSRRSLIVPFNGTFKAEQARLAVVETACLLGGHYHDSAELFFVVSGLALFTVEAVDPPNTREFYTLRPGDMLHVPARVGHLAQVTSGTILQTYTERPYTTATEYDNIYHPLRRITEAGVAYAGMLYRCSRDATALPQDTLGWAKAS
jgi:mannose-6-phosphate isomerase-like protein (cupin superfamily)